LSQADLNEPLAIDDFGQLARLERDFRNRNKVSYFWRVVENFDDSLPVSLLHQLPGFGGDNQTAFAKFLVFEFTYWLTIIYCDRCAYAIGLETIKDMSELNLGFCLNCPCRESEEKVENFKVPIDEQTLERMNSRALGP
jgi:hypothetical protein